LRLHGVDSREHLVYKELTCIKQYFEKIKVLETSPEKRAMALDKKAADPFIKHGLVGVVLLLFVVMLLIGSSLGMIWNVPRKKRKRRL
jgi:hypothetical protein